jgi:hypothetical protein
MFELLSSKLKLRSGRKSRWRLILLLSFISAILYISVYSRKSTSKSLVNSNLDVNYDANDEIEQLNDIFNTTLATHEKHTELRPELVYFTSLLSEEKRRQLEELADVNGSLFPFEPTESSVEIDQFQAMEALLSKEYEYVLSKNMCDFNYSYIIK